MRTERKRKIVCTMRQPERVLGGILPRGID